VESPAGKLALPLGRRLDNVKIRAGEGKREVENRFAIGAGMKWNK